MTEIEADSHVGQVTHFENQNQMLGRGCLAEQILHQQPHAKWPGKRAKVLKSSERKLNSALRPCVFPLAEMNHKIAKGYVFGRLQRALHLIHRVDAPGLVWVQDIHAETACAAHLAVSIQRGVH